MCMLYEISTCIHDINQEIIVYCNILLYVRTLNTNMYLYKCTNDALVNILDWWSLVLDQYMLCSGFYVKAIRA
jgi:hypothetical protein